MTMLTPATAACAPPANERPASARPVSARRLPSLHRSKPSGNAAPKPIKSRLPNRRSLEPPPLTSKPQTNPYAPRHDDGPGVTAWRRRMDSPHGKAVYKRRSMGECINARFRQWNLRQFLVRGRLKVQAVLGMFALANNILQGHRLINLAT